MSGGFHIPLDFIALWPVPNYVSPITRPIAASVIAGVLAPVTLGLLFARLWVRLRIQRNGSLDDWLMIVSVPFIIALSVLIPLAVDKYHGDRHIWDVEFSVYTLQKKLGMAIELNFVVVTGLVKISILLFYRRLGGRGVSRTFRMATWTAMGSIMISTVTFFLLVLLECRPLSAFWEQSNPAKILSGERFDCLEEGPIVLSAGIISTAQNFITALLPTFIYWETQIPFRQKAALFGIFATGYLVVAFGALRTHATYVLFYETYDISWQSWEVWNWTLLELYVSLACANSPALKIFFKQVLNIKSSSSSKQQHHSKHRSTESQYKSTTGRSRSSKLTFWKDTYANYGYHSQPTQLSIDEHGGVYVNKSMELDGNRYPEEATDETELVELVVLDSSVEPSLRPAPPRLPEPVHVIREGHMSNKSTDDVEKGIVGAVPGLFSKFLA